MESKHGADDPAAESPSGAIDQTLTMMMRPWSALWTTTILGGLWQEAASGGRATGGPPAAATATRNPVGAALQAIAEPTRSRTDGRGNGSMLASVKDLNSSWAAQSTSWLSLVQDVQREMTSTVKSVAPRLPAAAPLMAANPLVPEVRAGAPETGGDGARARAGKRGGDRKPAFEPPSLEQGGFAHALVRTLLLVALAEGPVSQADFETFENLRRLHPRLNPLPPGGLARIAREQYGLSHGNRHKAAETIPCLLPRRIDRAEVLDVVRAVLMAPGRLSYRGKGVFWGLEERLG